MPGVILVCLLNCLPQTRLAAQLEAMMLDPDEHLLAPDLLGDVMLGRPPHDAFAPQLGGRTERRCGTLPCNGWVEDRRPDGTVRHRGRYVDGQLLQYTDLRANGTLERELKHLSSGAALLRQFHGNGRLRTETRYLSQRIVEHTEFHPDGSVRYVEVMHDVHGYALRMASYAANGVPLALRQPVEGAAGLLEQRLFWPDGRLKSEGLLRWDAAQGALVPEPGWRHFDALGTPVLHGDQVDAAGGR